MDEERAVLVMAPATAEMLAGRLTGVTVSLNHLFPVGDVAVYGAEAWALLQRISEQVDQERTDDAG